jgi:hypothetical protein
MADPAVSQIFQLVTEIETLMKQYTRQDSDGTVLEGFQHYLTSSTIFREIWATWWSLLMWDSYINSLLLLVTIISHSWGLLLALAVTIFLPISREKPAPLLSYIRLPLPEIEDQETLIERNLACLSQIMQLVLRISRLIRNTRSEFLLLCIVAIFFIPYPVHSVIVVCMFSNTFWWKGLTNFILRRRSTNDATDTSQLTQQELESTASRSFTVYEQQRWWLGKWSEKLLGKESVPWMDARSGISENTPRESYTLPSQTGYKWTGPWQVETGPMTDNDGWQYAKDFSQKFWTPKKDIRDFVRRRKWARQYTKAD